MTQRQGQAHSDRGIQTAGSDVRSSSVTVELLARLSPLLYDHIDFLGRYAFTQPAAPGLRPLRDPLHAHDESDDGEAE